MMSSSDLIGIERRKIALNKKIECVNDLEEKLHQIITLWDKPLEEESFITLMGLIKDLESCAFRTWANLFNTSAEDRIGLLHELNCKREDYIRSEIMDNE